MDDITTLTSQMYNISQGLLPTCMEECSIHFANVSRSTSNPPNYFQYSTDSGIRQVCDYISGVLLSRLPTPLPRLQAYIIIRSVKIAKIPEYMCYICRT